MHLEPTAARLALSASCVVGVAAGCNALAGVDALDYGASATTTTGAGTSSGAGTSGGGGGGTCAAPYDDDIDNCGQEGQACTVRPNSVPSCDQCACVNTCNGGFGDCDADAATGCETTLDDDDAHCGACGWSCDGASCVGGQCGAEHLTNVGSGLNGIVAHQGFVYWYETTPTDGAIYRCPNDGCPNGPEAVTTTQPGATSTFVARDSDAFFNTNGDIFRCALPDCSPVVFNDVSFSQDLQFNTTHLFWWQFQAQTPATLWRASLTGLTDSAELLRSADTAGTMVFAMDDAEVFWADSGEIAGCALADCNNTPRSITWTGNTGLIEALALTSTTLFVQENGMVTGLARDGSEGVEAVYPDVDCGLKTRGDNLTWMTAGAVVFQEVGGSATTLADISDSGGAGAGCHYAFDGDWVYAGNATGIYRARLPASFSFP